MFKFYSNDSTRVAEKPNITVDKHGRIYINSRAQKTMNINSLPHFVFLAYNPETRQIAFSNKGPEGVKPFKIPESRPYAHAKNFLLDNEICPAMDSQPHRYIFDKEQDGLYIFAWDNINNEPNKTTFAHSQPQSDEAKSFETDPRVENETAAAVAVDESKSTQNDGDYARIAEKIIELRAENPSISQQKMADAIGVNRNRIRKALKVYNL